MSQIFSAPIPQMLRLSASSFCKAFNPSQPDPAYEGADLESALLFGPFALKREDHQFDLKLQNEEAWWRSYHRLAAQPAQRLKLLRNVMADRGIKPLLSALQSFSIKGSRSGR